MVKRVYENIDKTTDDERIPHLRKTSSPIGEEKKKKKRGDRENKDKSKDVRRKNVKKETAKNFLVHSAGRNFDSQASRSLAQLLSASQGKGSYVPWIVTKVSRGVLRGSRQVDRGFFPGIPITRVEQVIVCPYLTPEREG